MSRCETPDIYQFKTISEQKSFLRKRARTFLKDYCSDLELMKQCSLSAFKSVKESEEYKNAPVILGYMAMKDEISLDAIFEDALRNGKKVALPRMRKASQDSSICENCFSVHENCSSGSAKLYSDSENRSSSSAKLFPDSESLSSASKNISSENLMDFFYIDKLSDASYTENAFKIQEPNPDGNLERVDVQSIPENSLIFVPGLCFNLEGARLGRGKGYYDRFLSSLPEDRRFCICGVCFTICVTKAIPVDENDFYVNHLLTEYGFISVK